MNKKTRPSDFTNYPWDSLYKNAESETAAQNVMKILKRTGDNFRELTFEEYKKERLKDGNFSTSEERYFDNIIFYTKSAENASQFSKEWQ